MPLPRYHVKEKKPFQVPFLIHLLSTWATVSDLFKLRQINEVFYSQLSPIYLNLKQVTIKIDKPLPLLRCAHKGGPYCRYEEIRPIVVFGREISRANWDPNIAYLFKHLIIENLWFIEKEIVFVKRFNISRFISQLCSHVTKLTLKKLPRSTDFKEPNESLTKFIQRFNNLKELCIGVPNEVSQLNFMINLTNPIKISIDILNLTQFEAFFTKFGSSNNSKLKINLDITIESQAEVESLLEIAPQYSNFIENLGISLKIWLNFDLENLPIIRQSLPLIRNNLKINLNLTIWNRRGMKLLEKIALEYSKFIDTFEINLWNVEIWTKDDDKESHISIIRKSLQKLSPFITKLSMVQWEDEHNFNWNIFNLDCPKLQEFKRVGRIHELEFLKNCPELEYLTFRLFRKSIQENQKFLEYYLKYMKKLKQVTISWLVTEDSIDDDIHKQNKELLGFLISLLEESVEIIIFTL